MHFFDKGIHVTVTCTYCSTVNDLIAFDVANQEVRCSRCGDVLGNLAELHTTGEPPPEFRDRAGHSGARAD